MLMKTRMKQAAFRRPLRNHWRWLESCLLSVFNESGLSNWSELTRSYWDGQNSLVSPLDSDLQVFGLIPDLVQRKSQNILKTEIKFRGDQNVRVRPSVQNSGHN
jgi:hypothetical protein